MVRVTSSSSFRRDTKGFEYSNLTKDNTYTCAGVLARKIWDIPKNSPPTAQLTLLILFIFPFLYCSVGLYGSMISLSCMFTPVAGMHLSRVGRIWVQSESPFHSYLDYGQYPGRLPFFVTHLCVHLACAVWRDGPGDVRCHRQSTGQCGLGSIHKKAHRAAYS